MKKLNGISFTILIVTIALLSLISCKNFKSGSLSEGEIEYEVTYPPSNTNDYLVSLLPSSILYTFKDDKACISIKVSMGLVTTKFISKAKNKEAVQTLSLLGKKYAACLSAQEVEKLISKEPAFTIKLKPEQKIIAGYNCKKAHIDFVADSLDDFDVFYTKEIAISEPNWSSPFREIEGVLMEFKIHKYGVDMILKAKNVVSKEIEDNQFEISDDYKKIPIEEMDKMFSDME